jgi:hypothetical protein
MFYLFSRVLWSAHCESRAVRTPGKVGDSVGLLVEALVVLQLERLGVKVPDYDGHVLGSGRQLEPVGGEAAEPDLLAVVVQDLYRLAGKVRLGAAVVDGQAGGVDDALAHRRHRGLVVIQALVGLGGNNCMSNIGLLSPNRGKIMANVE